MLCLASDDIGKALSLSDTLDAVEEAFLLYERHSFHMPLRSHIEDSGNTLLLMPCFISNAFGTKLVSLFPGNVEKGLPVLNGLMILCDGSTGKPRAILPGAAITAWRTGAVGGVAVRILAGEGVKVLGIVGAGVQGFHQALFACSVRPFTHVLIFDDQKPKIDSFIERLSRTTPRVNIQPAVSAEQLVKESDVIITATDSQRPVLPDDEGLFNEKVIVGIGSFRPQMRELPDALFKNLDRLFVDTDHAAEESGDVIDPVQNGWISRERVLPLGRVIAGKEEIPGEGTIRCFKSVGMALFDVVVSKHIVERAETEGLGTRIDLE